MHSFPLAKEKQPAIIFIDEMDAIGTKRFDSDKAEDKEDNVGVTRPFGWLQLCG